MSMVYGPRDAPELDVVVTIFEVAARNGHAYIRHSSARARRVTAN